MKKATKVTLILAGTLGIVGVGLSAGAVAMGASVDSLGIVEELRSDIWEIIQIKDWNLEDEEIRILSDGKEGDGQTKVYDFDVVPEIEIDLRYDELILCSHEETGLKVEVYNDLKDDMHVEMDGNVLEIKGSEKITDRIVTLYYPKQEEFRTIEIEVDAGMVLLEDDLIVQEMDVHIGAGELQNSGYVTADNLNVEVGTGSVEITGLSARQIDGECGIGSVRLGMTGEKEDYTYNLENGLGTIEIGSEVYEGISNKKTINSSSASGTMNLECGMGDIVVTFEE